jgi:signal transduction histidine kinase
MQESLQKYKYANANTIKIDLKKKNDDLVLVISDNGRGFEKVKKNG